MARTNEAGRRRGAVAVEAAIVHPFFLFLLLGLVVGGTGVFRYQQVACQAREAARWACVRGADYQKDTDQPSPTRKQILEQAVLPLTAGMDPDALDLQVQWIDRANNTAHDWDVAPKDVLSVTAGGEYVTNSVRVTVTYRWSPGLFVGTHTLKSVCEMPMAN